MDFSLKYSKTSKGAKAVLAKSRSLSSSCMLVLSKIDGKTPASAIQAKLQLNEEKFTQALSQLLDEAYIQVVQDFGPSVFDLNSAIEVSEISTEEFLQLALPEESNLKTQEQIEAEERARAYAEEQARKEAQAREQEEAERKLLMVTDILAKSGDKIDIEKLSEPSPSSAKSITPPAEPLSVPPAPDDAPISSTADADPYSLDFSEPTSSSKAEPKADAQASITASSVNAAEAEERVRKQAAERARQAEILRQEEERHKKAKAEAAAKHEAELRAKSEAERKAREETERRAQEKAEAVARAREEAERKAQEKARKAEEKARKEEERRARKEAEAARKLAEQKAREEARAQAKAEAERKAREEAERRAQEKAEAEARAREETERKAKEKAELQARLAAEAEAKAEAARVAREEARIREEALAAERAIAKEQARREAEAKAIVRSEKWAERRAFAEAFGKSAASKLFSASRPLLIGLAVVTVALLLMLQFISLGMWAQPMEQMIAASIGEPVKMQDLRASIWPRPHLIMEEVAIGTVADITARAVHVYPAPLTLWQAQKTIHTLEIDGLSINHDALRRPFNWLATTNKQGKFQLSDVSLRDVSIKIPEVQFPTFNAGALLNEDGSLKSASLNADNIRADILPGGNGLTVNIEAHNWQLPLGAPLVFDSLTAKGTVVDQQLDLSNVEGALYGGSMKALLSVNWVNGWNANGNFELVKVDMGQATTAVSEIAHLRGRLYARADISSSGDRPDQLITNPSIRARFEAEQGEIGGLDLARAAAGREQVGGVTRYDQLTGNWILNDQQYQLTQLALEAGPLSANGDISISPTHDLSGKVSTRLDLSSRDLQARFTLSGKLGNARISR